MDNNKITVEIYGEIYALKGSMDKEEVKALAKMLDEQMKLAAKGNRRLPPAKLAVLAALNVCHEYKKLEKDYQQLLELIKNE